MTTGQMLSLRLQIAAWGSFILSQTHTNKWAGLTFGVIACAAFAFDIHVVFKERK